MLPGQRFPPILFMAYGTHLLGLLLSIYNEPLSPTNVLSQYSTMGMDADPEKSDVTIQEGATPSMKVEVDPTLSEKVAELTTEGDLQKPGGGSTPTVVAESSSPQGLSLNYEVREITMLCLRCTCEIQRNFCFFLYAIYGYDLD